MKAQPLKPQALRRGDTVAIVAPAGVVGKQSLERGIRFLESLGLKVKVGPSVMHRWGYLAGSDEARVRDLMTAWTDPDVKAVIAARADMEPCAFFRTLILKPSSKIQRCYWDIRHYGASWPSGRKHT